MDGVNSGQFLSGHPGEDVVTVVQDNGSQYGFKAALSLSGITVYRWTEEDWSTLMFKDGRFTETYEGDYRLVYEAEQPESHPTKHQLIANTHPLLRAPIRSAVQDTLRRTFLRKCPLDFQPVRIAASQMPLMAFKPRSSFNATNFWYALWEHGLGR
jgi:hypothetical protein